MARLKRKCAFCHRQATSGEHLWDDWINEELPKKTRFDARKRLSGDAKPIKFVTVGLREKLPAVCTECNNGWMSALTGKVKERFSRSILSGAPFSLNPTDAALLAKFTFMKATVNDYCYGDKPFFTGEIRKRLKASLTIPSPVRMWAAAYQGRPQYSFINNFYRVSVDSPGPFCGMEFFCYTYVTGNLAVQLLAPGWKDISDWNKPLVALVPNKFWTPAATRFWPYIEEVRWPPEKYLGDRVFESFVYRFDAPINLTL